jgi:hypothetical protein
MGICGCNLEGNKRNEKGSNSQKKNSEERNKRNGKGNNRHKKNYEEWDEGNEKGNNRQKNNYEEWNERNEKRNNEKKSNTDSPPPPLKSSNKKDTCLHDSNYYEGKTNDENKKNKNLLYTFNQNPNFYNNKKNNNININFNNINEMPETNKKDNEEIKKENEKDYQSFEKDNNYENGKFEAYIYNNKNNRGYLDPQNNQLINKDCKYDIIIDIKSIKDLNKTGWNIIYSGDKETQRKMIESEKKYIISVLGNSNRGKTYLLQKLCGENLDSGYQIQTKGLSMKFHKELIYLDTAGTNTPLLIEEGMKKPNETELQNIHLCQIITNYIIQTFVIEYADILICVVGMLNSAEQIFLEKIKKLS